MLHQIGVGALGPVFRTYEPARDRLVAVKAFRLDIVPERAQTLADELSRAAEAGLFHPSIVEPIAAGVEGTLAYRAEEYVAAESLDVAMRHYAPAPLAKVLPFITQLAGAIDFARAAGVGHGGLHPRDIFVTPDEARATGFGVVDALERVGIRAPVRRPYSAPERIAGAAWSTPADVFALAAIAFELLTGRRPAGTGSQIGALTEVPERASAIHAVLAQAMDDEPSRRYSTALGFAAALESAVTDKADVASLSAAATAPPAPAVQAPRRDVAPPPAPSEFADEEKRDPIKKAIEDKRRDLRAGPSPLFDAADQAATFATANLQNEPIATAGEVEFEDEIEIARGAGRHEVREQFADEFTGAQAAATRRPLEPVDETGAQDLRHDVDRYVPEEPIPVPVQDLFEAPERPKSGLLPLAVMLAIGLLGGFAAGYFVGGRERIVSIPSATTAVPDAGAPSAGGTTARQWSEQAVTAPRPTQPQTAKPPTELPPTVAEEPGASAGRGAPVSAAPPPSPRREPAAVSRGRLIVRSTPSRANVTVNGKWRGRTPLTLDDLPFGRYSVRVVQSGFEVERDDFALNASSAAHTMNVRLVRQPAGGVAGRSAAPARPSSPPASQAFTGTLVVDSRPQGANVLLDGKYVGKTPLRLPDIRIGSHIVRLDLPEHRPWSSMARVAAGEEVRVTASLERLP